MKKKVSQRILKIYNHKLNFYPYQFTTHYIFIIHLIYHIIIFLYRNSCHAYMTHVTRHMTLYLKTLTLNMIQGFVPII